MRWFLGLLAVIGLALGGAWAAGLISFGTGQPSAPGQTVATAPVQPGPAAANSAATATTPAADDPLRPASQPETRPVMQLQVVLDRQGFSPGVIDGKEGMSLTTALRGFQRAHGLNDTGDVDDRTRAMLAQWDRIPSTRTITIDAGFAAGPFAGPIPHEPEDQARLSALGYSDLLEKLAERYHTTPDTLRALNPAPGFAPRAGAQIVVPNIIGGPVESATDDHGWRATLTSLGVAGEQPRAARLVVDKSERVLMAYDADDHLIAQFPATMGSTHDPLPLGRWEIRATAHNPPFHYNPALFWDASPGERRQTLPPGPNGPVGVVWIDLSKEHYGIHGTPAPQTIGRTQSHGCIRLTNWDAARLAQMVRPGITALFQP
jgi:lipoprotein-anchoring transpeptidase ErfK/SrfK